MSRKPKSEQPPSVERRDDPNMISQERRYELITPLFGGGAETQQADPITVVRATEVRGQLRFWWRATRGGQFDGSLERLKAAEDALFGSMGGGGNGGGPSLVQVEVQIVERGQDHYPYTIEANRNNRPVPKSQSDVAPGYAAFPLQPAQKDLKFDTPVKPVRVGVIFDLILTYPADLLLEGQVWNTARELESALWAWETFGGLGARTRRGFGALHCMQIDSAEVPLLSAAQLRQSIIERLTDANPRTAAVVEGSWPKDIPYLGRQVEWLQVVTQRSGQGWGTPLAAWSELIRTLSRFRQPRDPATQPNQPGRNRWPEPDAVRRIVDRHSRGHEPRSRAERKFPRAAFGLPIVFHFKQQDVNAGDPPDTMLQGSAKIDRLASPLILRPLLCQQGGRRGAVGLALVLQAPRQPSGGLKLAINGNLYDVDSAELSLAEAKEITEQINGREVPLLDGAGRPDGTVDVLRAFMNYLVRK